MYQLIVIGGSTGSTAALIQLLPVFPANCDLPVVVVQHSHQPQSDLCAQRFDCALDIETVVDKELIRPGRIYVAPPNYHVRIERDRTFSLTSGGTDLTRPSIDVLFESAAGVYRQGLVGVLLTGSHRDGTDGLRSVKQWGGLTIVQEPRTATHAYMPQQALVAAPVDHVVALSEMRQLLLNILEGIPA